MFPIRFTLAAAAGVVAVSGTALAGQPINLLAPTRLDPSSAAIQETPLPPPGAAVTASPRPAIAAPQPLAVLPAPPPAPVITKALLPGHWQLGSWQYHWVPPETQLRTVETRAWVQGHYVWRGGAWTWVPSHYGNE